MRTGSLIVLFVIVVAACAGPAPSPPTGPPATPTPVAASGPTRICPQPFQDAPQPVSCTEAIGRVLLRLGPDARFVQAAWFNRGLPCPPNARCIAPPVGSGYVVVRFEGGRVSVVTVTFDDEGISVGDPAEPTYEIWPRTGKAGPALPAPELGIDGPAELVGGDRLPFCGEERNGTFNSAARRCFLDAVLDGRPAELAARTRDTTAAGIPAFRIYRYAGRGPVFVYRNGEGGGSPWVREDCAIAPSGDEETVFVTEDCLPTPIS